jgi:hypothetical protein
MKLVACRDVAYYSREQELKELNCELLWIVIH